MNAFAPLSVELTHQEVTAANAEAVQRSVPSPTLYKLAIVFVFLAAMETGLGLAFMLGQRTPLPYLVLVHQFLSMALPALLFLIGFWAVNTAYNRIAARRYAREITSNGTPESVSATYSIEHAGFRLSTPRGEWLAKWISISRLSKTSGGWLVGNDLGNLFVPQRAFADIASERAWVAAMVDKMKDEAVTASAAATDFAIAAD
ncbi:hypothetical protein [Novosphingobium sp.]|uniref:hypothetical protein n=1 Tax=Novosphingobium sp. TaxID=1874826 RepID=UPI00286DC88E|nr:hypothetical protein [Novosphingobium sp.]